MKRILVVVDMQNDFTTGPLGNAECAAVIPKVVEVIKTGVYDRIISPKTRTRVIIWIRRKESGCPSCTASKEPKAGRLRL